MTTPEAPSLGLGSGSAFVIELEQFTGALDLLLHLLREEQLEIADIPIARIADQFLRVIHELGLNQAADYLEMASRLVRLKAQMLIPRPGDEEGWEDPRAELVRRLLEYQYTKEIALWMERMADRRSLRMPRGYLPPPPDLPPPPLTLDLLEVLAALERVIAGILHPVMHSVVARPLNVEAATGRIQALLDTLALVRDHPEGVGAGNFERAFIPYALAGRSKPGETVVFRSPHNDYLRLAAEEGLAAAVLLLALVAVLARELHRSPAIARWRSEPGALLASCGAFLLVEACFQFPFEMACPALLAAVLLGLALAGTEATTDPASPPGPSRPRLRRAGDAATVLLALAIGLGLVRVAVAERLVARPGADVAALERACALDPRRLPACVEAAWLRSRAGEHAAARRAGLLVLLNAGQPQIDENGNASSITDSMQRCPDGGALRETSTYALGPPTPGTANACTVPVEPNTWGTVKGLFRN